MQRRIAPVLTDAITGNIDLHAGIPCMKITSESESIKEPKTMSVGRPLGEELQNNATDVLSSYSTDRAKKISSSF